ncbi:exo-alpha-sialidase [Streptomyces sp. ODS28]|uniref:exo-alpha-sialidase n=1 Tax=Streptomyces sp. ODS28 TaxID=3136688 RepID=UPI0031E5B345
MPQRPRSSRRPRRPALPVTLLSSLAVLGGLLTATAPAGAAPRSADAPFEEQVLFKPSDEKGYACFRIPAAVRTERGTLLAFAEGRVDDCSDAGDIDLVLKRSTDGGRTWGPLQVINQGGGDTHGNPAPVVDRRTGRILLAETYNRGRGDGRNCELPCDRRPHLQHSDDDGRTWSRPRELTDQLRPPSWNAWYATGPGHAIQLRHGRHAGRLVVGLNAESAHGTELTHAHAALAYSDDGGRSWRVGATDTYPYGADGGIRQKPQELTLAERRDGSLYVSARETGGTDLGHRTATVSRDGGATFTAPFRALPSLYTPQVQGSVLPFGPGRMLLSAPADPERRRTMMIRSSWDEGRSWEGADRGRVVTRDWSGYSDLVRADAAHAGLFYEAGPVDARDEMRFARFTESWLGPRRGPDPRTPDLAPGARPAAVLGGARRVSGRFGDALAFDGVDDAVRLPFRRELPLGERPFTASLWFRSTASAGEQPLLWMGGVGAQPHVRLVGDPAHGALNAAVRTPEGITELSVKVPFSDGGWHRAELRRAADGTLRLTADATTSEKPGVRGTVTEGSPFGVHVGQRVDARAEFTGAVDEVRVRTPSGDLLHLPMDRLSP